MHTTLHQVSRITASVLIALACSFVVSTIAAPSTARADDTGVVTVKVGYYENEVFEEGAEDGAIKTGYAYEYYRKISEYTGWKYEYVYGEFGDLYDMLVDGDIDLLAGLAYKPDRANFIGYPSLPMGNETYNLVKHATDDSITSDSETLSDCTIGALDSAMVDTLNQYLATNDVEATVEVFSGYNAMFDAFNANEIDVMAVEGDGAYGRDDAEVLAPFGSSDYYLCANIARPDIMNDLNDAQAALAVDEPNYLSSLRSKYYATSISARAFSTAEKEWLATHSNLRVGYLENYMPYSGKDDNGQATGIVKDIIPEILTDLGINNLSVSFIGYKSYDNMISDMADGAIDVAFPVGGGLYFSEENNIYQSHPVASASTELVHKGAFTKETTSTFAVNENNRMQYYFVRSNFPDSKIDLYPSIDACLEAVISGKATCTTLNGLRANDILKNSKYSGLVLYQLGREDDRCFGVEIGNEGLLKLLNRGINVVGDDFAQNISYRYTTALYSYTLVDALLDNIFLVLAGILAIAALIVWFVVRDSRRTRKQMAEKERARLKLETQQVALQDALANAESASRAKTTFLNNMSHDIRTPMNAIVGFTTLASHHIDDKDMVSDYLAKISVSSQHLLSLINDVLDMSRIESGNVTIDESEVNILELIDSLRSLVEGDAKAKGVNLVFDVHGIEHSTVVTDRLRLNQVFINILSNAVKFTPEGGTITFSATEAPATSADLADFEFRIKDTGIGISDEFQKTIFDAFSRERTSTVSGIEGTGLGMAITKNIVDMLGGAISVKSEVGVGSEFVVELPCHVCGTIESAAPAPVQPHNAEDEPRDFTGKRVLLAEDNEMNQMIAEAILNEVGLEVDIAADGSIAVEKVASADAGYYDIVLMDIQMPKMDGYEAARQIRNLPENAKASVPIVAVTANAFEEDRQIAMQAGMNGHLAKPYDIPKMMETLAALIK